MRANLYLIRFDEHRLVAAEVEASQAAAALAEGRLLLLADSSELAQLARQRNRALVVIASQGSGKPQRGPAVGRPPRSLASRPGPAAITPRSEVPAA